MEKDFTKTSEYLNLMFCINDSDKKDFTPENYKTAIQELLETVDILQEAQSKTLRNMVIEMFPMSTQIIRAKELSDEVSGSGQMGFKDLDNNSRVTVPREFYRKKLENF